MVSEARVIELHYRIEHATERTLQAWVLPEVPVPESQSHDRTLDYLKALLIAWVARSARKILVARGLALRWVKERPRVGIDPDLCLVEPAPEDAAELESLCLWRRGHVAPRLCIEVVSRHHPYKDYGEVHERYAACGVEELWVLDPRHYGPKKLGGPWPIQIWRREPIGVFARVYQGAGPARSEVLDAWVRVTPEGVRLSDDSAGKNLWLTGEEAERAAKEAERAAKEAERAAKEAERAAKEAERAAKEAERQARIEVEQRLARLEAEIEKRN